MIIYMITNDVNNKVYIGQTTKSLKDRIMGHRNSMVSGVKTHIYNAMRKYGWEHFTFHVIDHAETQEELDRLEEFYIQKYDAIRSGYNMAPGGSTNPMTSPIVAAKHAQSMKDPEVRQRIGKSVKRTLAAQGGPSAEAHQHMSEARKRLYASPEGDAVRAKFRASFRLSPEHYRALNDAKNKSVYCVNEAGEVVKEFDRVKDAAVWWYQNGYDTVKRADLLMDRIKQSFKEDRFIHGLKWIYRV